MGNGQFPLHRMTRAERTINENVNSGLCEIKQFMGLLRSESANWRDKVRRLTSNLDLL